jgi:hypothetical protein
MALGKKCPTQGCNTSMRAEREDNQRMGRYVTYSCPSCNHQEKVFQKYADGVNPWGERVS